MHAIDISAIRADYRKFMSEYGLSDEFVATLVNNQADQIQMPGGFTQVRIGYSEIDGQGLFVTRSIQPGEMIAPARIGGKRTPAGRFTNHSPHPNAKGVKSSASPDSDIDMVAIMSIEEGEEVVIDYRNSMATGGSGLQPLREADDVAQKCYSESDIRAYLALPRAEQIVSLLADLMENGDRNSPPIKHTFCNGMYMRELFIKKHTLLAGVVHRVPCLNICSSGDIDIATNSGSMRVGGGYTVETPAYMQKLGYAFEDTIWVNVFRTDETDIAKLERDLFLSDAEMINFLDPTRKHFKNYRRLT